MSLMTAAAGTNTLAAAGPVLLAVLSAFSAEADAHTATHVPATSNSACIMVQ